MNKSFRTTALLAAALALVATGCATKKYVGEQVGASEAKTGERVAGVETGLEQAQMKLKEHDDQIATTSKTAQDALDRAIAAGKLAEGKLLYETVLTDDKVKFGFDKSDLSDEAKAALDEFRRPAQGARTRTSTSRSRATPTTSAVTLYNEKLGQQRAEAVRRVP